MDEITNKAQSQLFEATIGGIDVIITDAVRRHMKDDKANPILFVKDRLSMVRTPDGWQTLSLYGLPILELAPLQVETILDGDTIKLRTTQKYRFLV